MVLVPAFLMVSTVRYRSFKSIDLGTRRSYRGLLLMALVIAAIATHPQITLVVVAYGYLASGLAGWAWARLARRAPDSPRPIGEAAVATGTDTTPVTLD
jgi:CDP-diacylglycerol--serine O-phosphatidyltransferase